MKTNNEMTSGKWLLLFFVAGFVDLLQVILDLFAVGLAANRVIDLFIGFGLPIYLQFNGIPIFEARNFTNYLLTFIGEEIPVVDALPLWTYEVYRAKKNQVLKDIESKVPLAGVVLGKRPSRSVVSQGDSIQTQQPSRAPRPLNVNGVREPAPRQRMQLNDTKTSSESAKNIDNNVIEVDFAQQPEKSSANKLNLAA